jgi:hypothetical protein
MSMGHAVTSAGERVLLESEIPRMWRVLEECADGTLAPGGAAEATIHVSIQRARGSFDTRGWVGVTRGSWQRDGRVVVENVCSSGFDMSVHIEDDVPRFVFRLRPPTMTRVARLVLPTRALLLARSVLLHFPAMWWAGTRGRAPLHAPAVTVGDAVFLLAGAGGTGKSTLVLEATESGEAATGDNLSVGDGTHVWGVTEPLRGSEGAGRSMPYGRRETRLGNRTAVLKPDRLVVLSRGPDRSVRQSRPREAARTMVASTYAAGELRRYWSFAAVLALGTGVGPAHPSVDTVAAGFANQLPCLAISLPNSAPVRLSEVLGSSEATTCA